MPLIKSGSKKALKKNIETEMKEHPGKRAQDIAIAYSIKRQNAKKKKMAEGGAISAKSEKRPMPDEMSNDRLQASQNKGDKSLKQSDWTGQPTVAQAQKPSRAKLKHPRMVPSDAFSVRLRDQEDALESSAKVNEGAQEQPPHDEDEMDAKKMGKSPDMSKPHSAPKSYAKGGMINEEVSMKDAEEDADEHPADLEEDDDQMKPAEDEIMEDHFAEGGMANESAMDDIEDKPDKGYGKIIFKAEGGTAHEMDEQPEDEAMEEHYDSIAAAIMAKKDRMKMAEGGQVDLDENSIEQPNDYYKQNKEALKENYDSDMEDVSQPMESNEHGHELSDEDAHSMIEKIRSKMAVKRMFK